MSRYILKEFGEDGIFEKTEEEILRAVSKKFDEYFIDVDDFNRWAEWQYPNDAVYIYLKVE